MITEKKTSAFPGLILGPVTFALLLVGWQMENGYVFNIGYFLVWASCLFGLAAAIYVVWASLEWKKDEDSEGGKAFVQIVEGAEKVKSNSKIKLRPYIQWAIFILLIAIGYFFTAICFLIFTIGGVWFCNAGAKYPKS